MTGGDQREPLWASSLVHEPRRELEPFDRPPEPDEPEEAVPQRGPAPLAAPRAAALGIVAGLLVAVLATLWTDRSALTVREVPSAWGDVRMTCDTARFEAGARALELFNCRAVGRGALPPGTYRSPGAQWTSDLTRRDARLNEIEISPDGELSGWAVY